MPVKPLSAYRWEDILGESDEGEVESVQQGGNEQ